MCSTGNGDATKFHAIMKNEHTNEVALGDCLNSNDAGICIHSLTLCLGFLSNDMNRKKTNLQTIRDRKMQIIGKEK